MATYYLISCTNANNHKIYGLADNKKELEKLAYELWQANNDRLAKEGLFTDIWDEFLYKNHKILSKTAVIKAFGKRFLEYPYY